MLKLFSRYILVGLVNTGLTAAVIFMLMWAGVGLYIANALGYIAGIALSFILNTFFTFSTKMSISRLSKFLVTCLFCYLLNLFAIKLFLLCMPNEKYLAQLAGMVLYTLTGFVLNKLWVMK